MQTDTRPSTAEVWDWLAHVPDPEIPVISLTDLGIIRDVAWDEETLVVTVTPTYSGCPATAIINLDIEKALHDRGVGKVRLKRQISPPWTTDWITAGGRDKLRAYGIAPPIDGTAADGRLIARVNRMAGGNLAVACPRCGSVHTSKVSQFGSTPCKASYRCDDCLEPFDYFKCI
jgi:ring-1,2-phenylacetyl-CoA epoxidase subunit PaaD